MNETNIPIEKTDLKTIFLERFNEFENRINTTTALHQIRKEAIAYFNELGFPTVKNEEWKYTNIKEILNKEFVFDKTSQLTKESVSKVFLPDIEANVLVFINGFFHKEFSRIISPESELIIKNFAEAYQSHSEIIENYFAKYSNIKEEAFTALNTAFAENGAFIKVASEKIVQKPIILYFIADTTQADVASQVRNLFLIGKNSQATIIDKYDTIGDFASFQNAFTEIIIHQNASLEQYKIQNESLNAYHIGTTQVYQEKNSHYTNNTLSLNGALIRNNLHIILDGENIESNMYGLYMLKGKTLVDNHTVADHKKPNSFSNELYKGILDEKSSGVFNGKIYVRPQAQKTNAYQQNRNVLLADSASVNTKPQLEIWADDVKCSHGATTGSLDQSALFYLRSRGIPEKEAKALLVRAFGYEIVEKIKLEALRNYLDKLIGERFHQN